VGTKRTDWQIDVLGGFRLAVGDAVVTVSSQAARQLIGWLAATGRAQTRDRAIGALWPDLDEPRARRQLSQALWRLRTDCGGSSPVAASTFELSLDPAAAIDLAVFHRGLPLGGQGRTERLGELVAAYGGPFMDGMYDDWIIEERGALEHRFVEALRELVVTCRSTGRLEDALAHARRWAQVRPLDEEAHRSVISLCALLGRVADGLEHYETCRRILDEEFGVEPAAETIALLAQLHSDVEASRDTDRQSAPQRLIGRRAERAELLEVADAVLAGEGRALFVEGDTGIGKSALLERFAHDAAWRGMTVARTACRLPSRPFGVVQDLIDSVLTPLLGAALVDRLEASVTADLALVAPSLRTWFPDVVGADRLSGSAGRDRMLDALTSALVALAEIGPTAIVVDDLCLADADSLLVIERVAERLEHVPLLLCLAYRPQRLRSNEAAWRSIRAVDLASAPTRLPIGPLAPRDSAALLDALDVDLSPESTHLVLDAAAGNPLQLEELARASASADPGAAAVGDATTLHAVIGRRVAQIPPADRGLVDVLAVVAQSVPLAKLAGLAGLALGELATAVTRLESLGIVSVQGDRVGLAREPIGAAVYESIAEPDRIELHGRALAALAGGPNDDIELLAFHAKAAQLWTEAADYLRLAAERAVSLNGYETAAVQFEAALEAARRAALGPTATCEILSGHVTVLDVLGRRVEQEAALDELEAATRASGASTVPVLVRRTDLLTRVDRFAEARKVSQAAAVLARASRQPMDMVLARLALGQTQALGGRPAAAVQTLSAAGQVVDAPEIRARIVHNLAIAHYQLGELARAVDGARLAATLYDAVGDHAARLEALGLVAYGTFDKGDSETALTLMAHSFDTARDVGYLHGAGVAATNLATLLSRNGQPVRALKHYDEAAGYLRRCGYRAGELVAVLNRTSASQTMLGPDSVSVSEIAAAVAWFDANLPGRYQALARAVLAEHHLLRGRSDIAEPILVEALHIVTALADLALLLDLAPLQVELLRQRGDWAGIIEIVESSTLLATTLGVPRPAAVDAIGALAAARLGQPGQAVSLCASLDAEAWYPPALFLWAAMALELAGQTQLVAEVVARGAATLHRALAEAGRDGAEQALRTLPAHRQLLAWQQRYEIQVERRSLPLQGVPTGRPLAAHEMIEVDLRLSVPEDLDITDAAEQRRERLRRLAADAESQGAYLRVDDLAELLAVGQATIKRDLQRLRNEGTGVRTRGTRPDDPEVRETGQTSEAQGGGVWLPPVASPRSNDPEVGR
jgi:DNA-binding SARP family transcriptional activator/tetratricopeptide (TPR) repeat protein